MVLQSSGMISFGNVATELGISTTSQLSILDIQLRQQLPDVPSPYTFISFSNFYGQTKQTSSFYRLVDQATNKTMIYDSTNNIIRLNAATSSTNRFANLNITQCNNAYSNSVVNFEGASTMQNSNNSFWLRHTGLILKNSTYSPNNLDFSWQFIQVPTRSNLVYIYNAYAKTNTTSVNGYFVGYSNNDDSVILTNNSNIFSKWLITPFNPSTIPLRPIAHAYAMQSINAMDLLPYYANGASVTKWGPFSQTNTTIAPLFYTSGGYLNRPYVSFFNTGGNIAKMSATSNTPFMMSNNTLSNWLSNSTARGVSFFLMINPRDTAANSGYMWVYSVNSNDAQFSCLRRNVQDCLRFNVDASLGFVGGFNGSFPYNTWSVQAFRYNLTTNVWNAYSTSTSNFTLLNDIQSGAGSGTPLAKNYIFGSNISNIGGANYFIDSMYVCDNWLDDVATLSTIRSMISGGNLS